MHTSPSTATGAPTGSAHGGCSPSLVLRRAGRVAGGGPGAGVTIQATGKHSPGHRNRGQWRLFEVLQARVKLAAESVVRRIDPTSIRTGRRRRGGGSKEVAQDMDGIRDVQVARVLAVCSVPTGRRGRRAGRGLLTSRQAGGEAQRSAFPHGPRLDFSISINYNS